MCAIHPSFMCYSYGAGLAGSLVYMRMLGNTVDSMADGAKGLVKYVICELLCQSLVLNSCSRWVAFTEVTIYTARLNLIPKMHSEFAC